MSEHFRKGELEVIVGSMKSSKSLELISRAHQLDYSNISYQAFRPEIDTRHPNKIWSRAGDSEEGIWIPATTLATAQDTYKHLKNDTKVILYDEGQFFDASIKEVVMNLLLQGKNVVYSGLDMDAEARDFGHSDFMMRHADRILKMAGMCEKCKDEESRYSLFVGGKEEQVKIGDSEYMVLCRPCYDTMSRDINDGISFLDNIHK